MELTAQEIRVLGCLVEKEATTPDNYPLSTNALTAACNQSTNRDPVVRYRDADVDAVMLQLRDRKLARTVRGDGQRVHKHKHVLEEAWGLDRARLAVLSLLMLRGPQTAAELRSRAERYGVEPTSTDGALSALGEGDVPFVLRLDRRPGERESRWTHTLGGDAPDTSTALPTPSIAADQHVPAVSRPAVSAPQASSTAAWASSDEAVRALTAQVEQLAATLTDVVGRLAALERELGLAAPDVMPDQNR